MKERFITYSLSILAISWASAQSTAPDSSSRVEYTGPVLYVDSLQHRNYSTLSDLMWMMPGGWSRNAGTAGQIAGLRLHGSTTSQVVLLWDGLYMNDLWTGHTDLTLIPETAINAIQKLPSSHPDNKAAIGGTLLFESAQRDLKRPFTKVHYKSGAEQYSDLHVLFDQQMTRRWHWHSGVQMQRYGSDQSYESSYSSKHYGQNVYSVLTFQYSDSCHFKFQVLSNQRDTNLPYSLPDVQDTLLIGQPKFKQNRFTGGITGSAFWHGMHHGIQYQFTTDKTTLRNRNVNTDTRLDAAMNRFQWHTSIICKLPLQAGFEWRHHVNTLRDSVDRRYAHNETAFWLDSELPLFSKLTWQTQLKAVKACHQSWKPLFLCALDFNTGSMHHQIAFRTAYRHPSPAESMGIGYTAVPPVFYAGTGLYRTDLNIKANRQLTPESARIIQWQSRWKQYIASCLYIRHVNMIQPVLTDEWLMYQNQGEHHFWGLDLQYHSPSWHSLFIEGVFSYCHSEDDKQSSLLERPYIHGNTALSWKQDWFENDLCTQWTLTCRYWSDFHGLNLPINTSSPFVYQPSNFTVDAKLYLIIMQHGKMGLSFDNLLNRKIYLIDTLPLQGRAYRFDFSWELFD